MNATGGESAFDTNVRFRSGKDEFPTYEVGAFATTTTAATATNPTFATGGSQSQSIASLFEEREDDKEAGVYKNNNLHYIKNVLKALQYYTERQTDTTTGSNDTFTTDENIVTSATAIETLDAGINKHAAATCKETWHGTTLFLTRYEYANLYHTITDWWNTYFSLPPQMMTSHEEDGVLKPTNSTGYRIVFLDGHAKGTLDDTWHVLFGGMVGKKIKKKNVFYIKELSSYSDGPICFDHAVLIPPGYSSRLYPRTTEPLRDCVDRFMADQFVMHVLQSYQLQDIPLIPGRIVIIDRQPYVAHSRSKLTHIYRSISNLQELKDRLLNETIEIVMEMQPQSTLQLPIIGKNNTGATNSTSTNPGDKIRISVQVVRLETLPFKEQIRTIRQAHILIGNHGAGLTHLMWMNEKSHVLELTTHFLRMFEFLCQWRWDISHSLIPLDMEETTMSTDNEISSNNRMSNATIAKVRAILEGRAGRLESEEVQQGIDLMTTSQDLAA